MEYLILIQKSPSTDKELKEDSRHYLKRLNSLRQLDSNLGISKILVDDDLRTSIQLVQGHADNKRLFDMLKKHLLKIYKQIQEYNLDKDNVQDEELVKKTKAREMQLFNLNINVTTMGDPTQMPVYMSLIKIILDENIQSKGMDSNTKKKPDGSVQKDPLRRRRRKRGMPLDKLTGLSMNKRPQRS